MPRYLAVAALVIAGVLAGLGCRVVEPSTSAAIERWDAPTHTVTGQATKLGFAVALADAESIPNRDFVIRWQAADASPRASLFFGPAGDDGSGHFQLVITPPPLGGLRPCPQRRQDPVVGRRRGNAHRELDRLLAARSSSFCR